MRQRHPTPACGLHQCNCPSSSSTNRSGVRTPLHARAAHLLLCQCPPHPARCLVLPALRPLAPACPGGPCRARPGPRSVQCASHCRRAQCPHQHDCPAARTPRQLPGPWLRPDTGGLRAWSAGPPRCPLRVGTGSHTALGYVTAPARREAHWGVLGTENENTERSARPKPQLTLTLPSSRLWAALVGFPKQEPLVRVPSLVRGPARGGSTTKVESHGPTPPS